jgi:regulator of protease activity HflC (stomatin/prohibitin superfamily)
VKDWNGAAHAVDKDGNVTDELSFSWFYGTIQPIYSNLVRQEVKNFDMQSLAFTGSAIDQIDAKVTDQLNAFIAKNKMPVRLLSVTIGRAVPPQEILDQRTETAAQQQRELTMAAKQKAEEARKGAEIASAEADNAYRLAMGQDTAQYIELKRIEMLRTACSRGTCIFGGGTPIINTGR